MAQEKQRNLVQLSPFSMLRSHPLFRGDWNWEDLLPSGSETQNSGLTVYEKDNHLVVEAEVPGIDSNNVDISYTNGVLSVNCEETQETKDEKRNYYRKESRTRRYRVTLPSDIDENVDPESLLKDGVLFLRWPLAKRNTTRKIKVNK